MNKIEDLYETACKFLELPDMARYMLGLNFYNIDFPAFLADEDSADRIVFQNAVRKGRWGEFKLLVDNFTETRSKAKGKKNGSYLH